MNKHKHKHNPHPNFMSNYSNKSMARSDSIKYKNMPDSQQKNSDPGLLFCCSSSAESSTCSAHMPLEPTNYSRFNLIKTANSKPEISAREPIKINKYGRNIAEYSDINNNSRNYDNYRRAYKCNYKMDMEEEEEEEVCSMCGDVGIAELLFLCVRCSLRPQHIYCSRSYPDLLRGEASVCNWCLHEEDSLTSISAAKASTELNATNALRTKASEVINVNYGCRTNANVITRPIKELTNDHVITRPIKELINHPVAHGRNEASQGELKDELVLGKMKGHGKAFEYLLLIAAQSFPQVISEANVEIKQANHTGGMVNSTNPKMGSLDNKVSRDNQDDVSNSERLSRGLESNTELQSNGSMNIDEKMDVGVYGGHIPKRQRCSKGINTSLKCRKKGLQLSPSRPNYRRYKLLADVVC